MMLFGAAAFVIALASPSPSPAPTPAFETTDYRFRSGGVELAGRLFRPRDTSTTFPLVVLVQGADYNDANASVYWRLIAHTFAKNGIASFSFNKRGVAGSGGKQTDDFDVQAADVAAACRFASSLPGVDSAKTGYYGTSQAGWIVPRAVRSCPGAFVMLVSPGGVPPAQTNEYYLTQQYAIVGMTADESQQALQLHDALAQYYRTAQGYDRAQRLVDQAVRSGWFAKLGKVDFVSEIPDSHRLPTPAQLKAIWQSEPDRYGFYRDAHTWDEPPSLYESLTAPLLLVYGGQDKNLPVYASFAVIQGALAKNGNPNVTIRIFETADHSIQVGPRVLPGYREYLAEWLKQQLK